MPCWVKEKTKERLAAKKRRWRMGYDKSISPPSVRPLLLFKFPLKKTLVQSRLSTIRQQFNQHPRFFFPSRWWTMWAVVIKFCSQAMLKSPQYHLLAVLRQGKVIKLFHGSLPRQRRGGGQLEAVEGIQSTSLSSIFQPQLEVHLVRFSSFSFFQGCSFIGNACQLAQKNSQSIHKLFGQGQLENSVDVTQLLRWWRGSRSRF